MFRRFARPAALAAAALVGLGAVVAVSDGSSSPDQPALSSDQAGSSHRASGYGAPSFAAPAGPSSLEASRAGGDGLAAADSGPAEGAPPSPSVGPTGLGGAPLPEAVAAGNARVIKTATVDVSVAKGKLAGAHQAALDAVSGAGGWVQSSQSGDDRATFVVKVPADRLDGVLAKLRGLGEVRSEALAGQDVSAEYVDLEARLRHWRAQEAVFVELMGRAKTIGETIQIQQQLSTVQEQIEQLEGRRRQLEGSTAFSTVNLSLLVDGAVARTAEEPRSTLARAWERAMGATLAVLAGTIVVLGVVVPLALVLAVPALVALSLRRRRPALPAQG